MLYCFNCIIQKYKQRELHLMQQPQMKSKNIILISIQLLLFIIARVLDDMAWHDFNIIDQEMIFQSVGIVLMTLSVILSIVSKIHINNWQKSLFVHSQIRFAITWALIATICLIFFKIFHCSGVEVLTQTQMILDYPDCCLYITLIVLTNLNFSLICNQLAHKLEFIVYQSVLFAEIIYRAFLLVSFVKELSIKDMDMSILYVSIIISNQVLIMDLLFRAAYEEQQFRQEIIEKYQRKLEIDAQVNADYSNQRLAPEIDVKIPQIDQQMPYQNQHKPID